MTHSYRALCLGALALMGCGSADLSDAGAATPDAGIAGTPDAGTFDAAGLDGSFDAGDLDADPRCARWLRLLHGVQQQRHLGLHRWRRLLSIGL